MIPKFRAWHKELKQMFEVTAICFREVSWHDFSSQFVPYIWASREGAPNAQSRYALDEVELMQWTQLNDIAGNCIYEGDIIMADDMPCVVTYDSMYGHYYLRAPNHTAHDCCWCCEKIIGNRWQNPELLEKA